MHSEVSAGSSYRFSCICCVAVHHNITQQWVRTGYATNSHVLLNFTSNVVITWSDYPCSVYLITHDFKTSNLYEAWAPVFAAVRWEINARLVFSGKV